MMERLEAQFQAHAAATASQRAPAPAAAPAPPPAVTVTTMPAAIQLSPVRARPANDRLVRIACVCFEGDAYRRFGGARALGKNTMKCFCSCPPWGRVGHLLRPSPTFAGG